MWTAAIHRRFAFGVDATFRLDSGGPPLKPKAALKRRSPYAWVHHAPVDRSPMWTAAIHRRFAFGLMELLARGRPPPPTPEAWHRTSNVEVGKADARAGRGGEVGYANGPEARFIPAQANGLG